MNPARLLWYYLWIAPHILLGIVFFLLLFRRLYRQFPIFTLYAGYEVSQFLVLFAMRHIDSVSGSAYFTAYSLGITASAALRFGIIYEISTRVFSAYPALSGIGKSLFRWVGVALLLISVVLAARIAGNPADLLMNGVHTLDRTVSILQCGLLLFLFVFSRYLNLAWRSQTFGIALGLGIFASVGIAKSALRLDVGPSTSLWFDLLSMGTYHCCVLIWMFYLWAPARVPERQLQEIPEHDLEKWTQELRRLLQQ